MNITINTIETLSTHYTITINPNQYQQHTGKTPQQSTPQELAHYAYNHIPEEDWTEHPNPNRLDTILAAHNTTINP